MNNYGIPFGDIWETTTKNPRCLMQRGFFGNDLFDYLMPYFLLNLSTRPLVSTSFCLPV